MIQTWRFPIVLSLSVLFGMPALHSMMTAPDQLFRSGFAYVGALALSWLGVNGVFTLMDHYAVENHRLHAEERTAELARERLEGLIDDESIDGVIKGGVIHEAPARTRPTQPATTPRAPGPVGIGAPNVSLDQAMSGG